jgi:lipopolysaccharide transport system ATP-binding protein
LSEPVIKVKNLSKLYRIGAKEGYKTFRETLIDSAKAPFLLGRDIAKKIIRPFPRKVGVSLEQNTIWALKDVSFEVKQGEVVGIIGKNGAGKSTLLKILSKITEPTEGRVELRGRVGSLLEVGTGFHPELTGHENVYLYGAILGMDRWEVTRKFDEIIAFAELEKFVDTPVKRYSSGMYMRLAFAVAAHLEPEILLVDEVLAVGDAAFQKKCLGKMGDVSRQGRTVLFVSHNMAAITSLCPKSILLHQGYLTQFRATHVVVEKYLASRESITSIQLEQRSDRRGNGSIKFTNLKYLGDSGSAGRRTFLSGQDMTILLECKSKTVEPCSNAVFDLRVCDIHGSFLFTCSTRYNAKHPQRIPAVCTAVCRIPKLPLAPGTYRIDLWSAVRGEEADYIENAGQFTVVEGDFFGGGKLPIASKHGPFLVEHTWSLREPN